MHTKKGQITIFIIAAILLIIGAGFALYWVSMRSEVTTPPKDLNTDVIKKYVESCMETVTLPGAYLIASKGGYIYGYSDIHNTEYEQVAYHRPRKTDTEKELEIFVKNSLLVCLGDFEEFEHLDFILGNMTVDVDILTNKLIVNVDYPVELKQGDSSAKISEFSFDSDVRLGAAMDISDEVVSTFDDEDALNKWTALDLQLNVLPYDRETMIFTLVDETSDPAETPLLYNFAVHTESNGAPRMKLLPDFTLHVGDYFEHRVFATDPDDDDIIYYSLGNLFEITNTGLIAFTPDHTGIYDMTICAEDPYGANICRDMVFTIKDG